MLKPSIGVRRSRLLFAVLGHGLSTGLGFAALGVALYAQGPLWPAAALFGAVGGACGVAAAVARLVREGEPPPLPVPLPADEMASLLRTTLAEAQQQRQAARQGSAADRQPAPVLDPAARPAGAGARPVPVGQQAERRLAASAVEA